MNTFLKSGLTAILIGCIFMALTINAAAQTNNHLLTLSFQKTEGKLFKVNAMNEKYFDFSISGVKSGSEIDDFKTKLSKQPGIRLVTVIPTVAADYQANVILVSNAKVKEFKLALIAIGYSTILIDGETKLLTEPEKE